MQTDSWLAGFRHEMTKCQHHIKTEVQPLAIFNEGLYSYTGKRMKLIPQRPAHQAGKLDHFRVIP
jgi:hypothetical protein